MPGIQETVPEGLPPLLQMRPGARVGASVRLGALSLHCGPGEPHSQYANISVSSLIFALTPRPNQDRTHIAITRRCFFSRKKRQR